MPILCLSMCRRALRHSPVLRSAASTARPAVHVLRGRTAIDSTAASRHHEKMARRSVQWNDVLLGAAMCARTERTIVGLTAAELRARVVPWPKANYYEDFTPGREFDHHWGRTLTESDNILFSTLTSFYNPLYFNSAYARAEGYERE